MFDGRGAEGVLRWALALDILNANISQSHDPSQLDDAQESLLLLAVRVNCSNHPADANTVIIVNFCANPKIIAHDLAYLSYSHNTRERSNDTFSEPKCHIGKDIPPVEL